MRSTHWLMVSAVLVVAALVQPSLLVAADDEPDPDAVRATCQALTNTGALNAVRAFAQQHNLRVDEEGTGAVRLFAIGGMRVDAGSMIEAGEAVLTGLDQWTGRNDLFHGADYTDEHDYVMIVFAQDGEFDRFIGWLRDQGVLGRPAQGQPDLTLRTKSLSIGRVRIAVASRVGPLAPNWATYSVCNAAIDTFFGAHEQRPPAWLREGLNIEMQRLLFDGQVRCSTIAYEMGGGAHGSDYAGDLAAAIQEGNPGLQRARMVLGIELSSQPDRLHYLQMWSICQYLRNQAGSRRGERNRFFQLLVALSEGQMSTQAVREVLSLEDPSLTNNWLRWAAQQG